MSNKRKEIEIISGDGSELQISKVYEHLDSVKPKSKKNTQNIVIPKISNDTNKKT